jgi:hypothetical protein
MRDMAGDEAPLDHDTQRALAVALFNRVWDLLDLGDARTAEETDEMIDAAHTSRYLWRRIGGAEQAVVGEWQISRVYAEAGIGPEAVRHGLTAQRLLDVDDDPGVPDWLAASVQEGLARAYLAAGEPEAAALAHNAGRIALAAIADAEDRELIESQLDDLGIG